MAFSQDQKVAAGHALGRAEQVLAGELPVHDRQAPIATAFQLLAELKTVAKKPQIAADSNGLVFDYRQAVVTRRGRACQNALADTIDDRLLEGFAVECEKKKTDSRPVVRGFFIRQGPLDAGFGIAADHRSGIPRRHGSRNPRPFRVLGRDDQPSRRHGKSLGKSIVNRDVVNGEQNLFL